MQQVDIHLVCANIDCIFTILILIVPFAWMSGVFLHMYVKSHDEAIDQNLGNASALKKSSMQASCCIIWILVF
jgi:hypothetical protein